MKKYEYDITSYSIEQVVAVREKLGYAGTREEPVLFCTEKGACFFDNLPNANTKAIQHILNQRGAEGWKLVSVNFRTDEMVCFWMREAQGS
ncbi:MAG TPA: DUF4177 domain-containing protein [Anaerolineae bacterium]|nr:DUF4177 domain-containing protein [Anaerolineae bacterium]HQJ50480.1 DUF4177 domain-containing protein [Anaerolineae bacterium]